MNDEEVRILHICSISIVVLGHAANAANIFVLLLRKITSTTQVYLAALSIADFIFFVSSAAYDVMSNTTERTEVTAWIELACLVSTNWFSAASVWLTVSIAVERLLGIKNPFSAAVKPFRKRHLVLKIFLIFAAGLVISGHTTVEFALVFNETGEEALHWYQLQQLHDPGLYRYVEISNILFTVFVVIVPIVALIACNVMLVSILQIRKRVAARHASHHDDAEKKVTQLVVVLTVAFVVFHTPSAAATGLKYYQEYFVEHMDVWNTLATVSNLLLMLGKSMNFFIYVAFSMSFRNRIHWILLYVKYLVGLGQKVDLLDFLSQPNSRHHSVRLTDCEDHLELVTLPNRRLLDNSLEEVRKQQGYSSTLIT